MSEPTMETLTTRLSTLHMTKSRLENRYTTIPAAGLFSATVTPEAREILGTYWDDELKKFTNIEFVLNWLEILLERSVGMECADLPRLIAIEHLNIVEGFLGVVGNALEEYEAYQTTEDGLTEGMDGGT
ncbi:hypothetical protein K470DRAFT_267785 [Piedraia hortae CBS 480.64]|uniref:Uncharacterized protein n=1 Tax=Piedraia hortae CBS 480.64 TaxID=1314780 RepID=A0A6A7C8L2_9PEZI|nr:hypothetical protein K470DRAFT_267785 [Piedraia hortae CBS 480.64]